MEPEIKKKCAQVRVEPETRRRQVLRNGRLQYWGTTMPRGGQRLPISTAGERAKWR